MALPTWGKRPTSTHQQAGTSPSNHEACTNLLDGLIHQRAESRSKMSYNPTASGVETAVTESQKNGMAGAYVPEEGTS